MAHRMQITLDDHHYERLKRESERTGASIAALVRRALDAQFEPELTTEERIALIHAAAGAWSDRDPDEDLRPLNVPMGPAPE